MKFYTHLTSDKLFVSSFFSIYEFIFSCFFADKLLILNESYSKIFKSKVYLGVLLFHHIDFEDVQFCYMCVKFAAKSV